MSPRGRQSGPFATLFISATVSDDKARVQRKPSPERCLSEPLAPPIRRQRRRRPVSYSGIIAAVVTAMFVVVAASIRSLPSPMTRRAVAAFAPVRAAAGRSTGQRQRRCCTRPNYARPGARDKVETVSAASSSNQATAASSCDRDAKDALLRSSSRLSLAPMMEYTDRHFRRLVRLVSSRTLLYSEMVAANAIAHERLDAAAANGGEGADGQYDATYLLRFLGQGQDAPEGPSVLQFGGSDTNQLRTATRTLMELSDACDYQISYTAVNLNCGCPSPKVAGKGCFGAALMEDPVLVRNLVRAMDDGCDGRLPVTVKCRIGTDAGYVFSRTAYDNRNDEEEYGKLRRFIETVASDGIATDFQIHARIAVLGKSFSPSDNRKVPPLRYDLVRRLAADYPELTVSLNGGIETLRGAKEVLDGCPQLAGVMIGRAWAANPWSFAMADEILYGDDGSAAAKPRNRLEILQAYGRHADLEEETWDPVKIRRFITKAASGLFTGEPNAKRFRIALDEIAGLPKKLARERGEGRWREGQPPISELIMNAATQHLTEEVLLRSPQESYDMLIFEEDRRRAKAAAVVQVAASDAKEGFTSDANEDERLPAVLE